MSAAYRQPQQPEWTALHRALQAKANVVQLVLLPVLEGRQDKAHEALRPLTDAQRRAVMVETFEVLEALLLRLPAMREELRDLWGDYLYAGYPDYEDARPESAP